jgi:glycosyltransferase involved in cell wall biosynthesis
MRIAIFSDNFYPELSGISDSIIASAQELAKMGHQICFFVPNYSLKNFIKAKISSKREIELHRNIKIVRFFSFSYPTPTGQGRFVIPIGLRVFAIRKFNPDVIHSHLFFGVGLEALFAAKILKVPLIGTNHTAIAEFVRYAPIKAVWLEKLSLKYASWYYNRCDLVTSPSELLLGEMRQAGFKKKGKVVYNPIDAETFNAVADHKRTELKANFSFNDKVVVFAGRFAPEKNIEIVLEAVFLAKKKIPDIIFALAGHGTHFEAIRELVKNLGLEKNVRFLGTLSHGELADLYRASEIFALASTSEIQSMTLLQAMASGLAPIGVRARGFEYIGENGILVEPGNAREFSEKIVLLLENHKLRNKISKGALEFAQGLSDSNIALEWEKIYKKIIYET